MFKRSYLSDDTKFQQMIRDILDRNIYEKRSLIEYLENKKNDKRFKIKSYNIIDDIIIVNFKSGNCFAVDRPKVKRN